jgi:hypothetical protein
MMLLKGASVESTVHAGMVGERITTEKTQHVTEILDGKRIERSSHAPALRVRLLQSSIRTPRLLR